MAHPRLRPLVAAVATLAALSGCTPQRSSRVFPRRPPYPQHRPGHAGAADRRLGRGGSRRHPYLAAGPAGILVRYTKAKKSAWVL
ncbi:MAG: hypothetical protein HZY73_11650 [Micropruina sp.]|nr:MAG: hypothetical protein HZY73_11650 [Micropruina sp.]